MKREANRRSCPTRKGCSPKPATKSRICPSRRLQRGSSHCRFRKDGALDCGGRFADMCCRRRTCQRHPSRIERHCSISSKGGFAPQYRLGSRASTCPTACQSVLASHATPTERTVTKNQRIEKRGRGPSCTAVGGASSK